MFWARLLSTHNSVAPSYCPPPLYKPTCLPSTTLLLPSSPSHLTPVEPWIQAIVYGFSSLAYFLPNLCLYCSKGCIVVLASRWWLADLCGQQRVTQSSWTPHHPSNLSTRQSLVDSTIISHSHFFFFFF